MALGREGSAFGKHGGDRAEPGQDLIDNPVVHRIFYMDPDRNGQVDMIEE